jgi:hypothetical protein
MRRTKLEDDFLHDDRKGGDPWHPPDKASRHVRGISYEARKEDTRWSSDSFERQQGKPVATPSSPVGTMRTVGLIPEVCFELELFYEGQQPAWS